MKIFDKFAGFITILIVFGLVFFACEEPESGGGLPALTGTVNISGLTQVEHTLAADTSDLNGSGTISYSWKRNGINEIGNDNTYTVQTEDVGSTITVTVTRANNAGSITSEPTAAITSYTPGLSFTLINNGTAYSVSKGTANSSIVTIPTVFNGLPVTEIADSGFSSYTNMKSIILPNGVERIRNYAFFDCGNLKEITIPAGVTSIGNFAFQNCGSLNTIFYEGESSSNWANITIGSSNSPLASAVIIFYSISSSGIEMMQLPAGALVWSDATITLSAFKMGKYEVTQEQYQAVMGMNPSYFHGSSGREPSAGEIQGKRPVENVTWYDAVEFCNKLSEKEGLDLYYNIDKNTLDPNNTNSYDTIKWSITINESANGYRLPTEAQWEYACRAGSTTNWYFGNDENQLINYAWYYANSNNMTHEVGKKLPNVYGLYDMHGNVWERCWDWYDSLPDADQTDYMGAVSGNFRVERGGSWGISAEGTRSSYRGNYSPFSRYIAIGFRVVRP